MNKKCFENAYFFLKCLYFSAFFTLQMACNTEGVTLTADDRYRIDTTASQQIRLLSLKMDTFCRDSTPFFRQRFVDSLVRVREQEILQQTQSTPTSSGSL